MAERLGRRARWTAVLVAVPGAAALFGAATSWALHAEPANGATTTPTPSHVQRPADTAVLGAQRSAAANQQELRRLEKQLARLRAQLATMAGSSRPAQSGQPGRSGQPAQSTAAPAPAVGTTHPPAPSPTAPTPPPPPPPVSSAPPPPVQTSTGASGAPK